MLSRITLVLALLVFLYAAAGWAQLGLKEGLNLKPTDLDRIELGQPAPDFTLENYDGNKITLSGFRGKKAVVLAFYRGHW